jgi:hypothetical protein
MLLQRFALQPDVGSPYASLLETAVQGAPFANLDAAIAYATPGGVEAVRPILLAAHLEIRWLVGIDWCRSHPEALWWLGALARSSVRIANGARVVARTGCTPERPFHPKSWFLRGADARAAVIGSGNLSSNGMTRGVEHGQVLVVRDPQPGSEADIWASIGQAHDWFEGAWADATPLADVLQPYRERFKSNLRNPVPVDDDATDVADAGRGGIDPERIRQLRAATFLWIEAGTLYKNRGPSLPGNQLDMSAMTRVFFGFPARRLGRNSPIGTVRIWFGGTRFAQNMRYGNNEMDKLNLPIPDGSPQSYDGEVLGFVRRMTASGVRIDLALASPAQRVGWLAASEASGTNFRMQGGRRWGLS